MKCNTAQELISLALDGSLVKNEVDALAKHLEHCSRCREFSMTMQVSHSFLMSNAQDIQNATLSNDFDKRLHASLIIQAERRESTPIAKLDRICSRLIDRFVPQVVRRPATVFALLIALLIGFGGILTLAQHPVPTPTPQYAFGHLPTFSISTLPDGRVCASVRSSTLVPRPLQVGVEQ